MRAVVLDVVELGAEGSRFDSESGRQCSANIPHLGRVGEPASDEVEAGTTSQREQPLPKKVRVGVA